MLPWGENNSSILSTVMSLIVIITHTDIQATESVKESEASVFIFCFLVVSWTPAGINTWISNEICHTSPVKKDK